LQAVRTPKRTC